MHTVFGKVGTHSSDKLFVKGRRPLAIGQMRDVKSKYDPRCRSWTRMTVDKINPDGFVFFSLV